VLGEDVGVLGDVNLVYEGLQAKHGRERVVDTGIREATIMGQGIGAALRGLRPVVDIQYVDYLLFALEIASDDLATTRHRTRGAPETIRDGRDLTLVTYGALCRIALEAAQDLAELGIDVEVIDARTLLPFDTGHRIAASVRKCGALLIVDENVPGGGSAYILQ